MGHDAESRTSFVYENFYESPFETPTLYALRAELAEHERGIGPRPPGFE